MDEVLVRHLPELRAYVRMNLGPEFRALDAHDDIVQSVCRLVLRERDQFDYRDSGGFRSWLFTIVLSKIRDRRRYHRAQKRDPRREVHPNDDVDEVTMTMASSLTPSRVAIARDESAALQRALLSIPEKPREWLLQRRVLGRSTVEIATAAGMSPDAVRQAIHRATVRLATCFETELGRSSGPR